MKKTGAYFFTVLGFGSLALLLPLRASAFCPLCMVATGTAIGFFRWLGVDDTIIGLWIGGFIISSSVFLDVYLAGKMNSRFKFQFPLVVFIFYLSTVALLYWGRFLNPFNTVWGMYKVVLGLAVGSILTLLAPYVDKFLRKTNQGNKFISHQKMIVALGILASASLFFYLAIK